ncbi:hypothetical protein AXF42_Ash015018 [Apostasia shenzhenica]|uniref:Uncharacterized protein n=1 Tax=Apostasia shenzhenica TaxID=1088818 RepID=A0A2I0B2X3_9ASPA|nr:hypothetical protein AXF42_Ash015018 [Apostasia shenzhenica]
MISNAMLYGNDYTALNFQSSLSSPRTTASQAKRARSAATSTSPTTILMNDVIGFLAMLSKLDKNWIKSVILKLAPVPSFMRITDSYFSTQGELSTVFINLLLIHVPCSIHTSLQHCQWSMERLVGLNRDLSRAFAKKYLVLLSVLDLMFHRNSDGSVRPTQREQDVRLRLLHVRCGKGQAREEAAAMHAAHGSVLAFDAPIHVRCGKGQAREEAAAMHAAHGSVLAFDAPISIV